MPTVEMRWVELYFVPRQGASEDPNFTAMIEEFRATRAFLREVLVFTDASALHIKRVMVRTAYSRALVPGNPAFSQALAGFDRRCKRIWSLCSLLHQPQSSRRWAGAGSICELGTLFLSVLF